MNIKEAEKATGVSARNIRFYEQKGLLNPNRNKGNDYREYSDGDIRRLQLIRAQRMVDMPLEKIREVVDGEVSLHDAAAAQKEKLEDQIKHLKVVIKFCGELSETEPENVKEVLERMDKPENKKELPENWKQDHKEILSKLGQSLAAGCLFPFASWFYSRVMFWPAIFADLIWDGFAGSLLLVCIGGFLLWGFAGYKLYVKKWWWLEVILAHICLSVMISVSYFDVEGKLSLLTYDVISLPVMIVEYVLNSLHLRSWYEMAICSAMFFVAFCLGMLLAKIKEVRVKKDKLGKSKLSQYFARHPRRKNAIKAITIIAAIISIGSIKKLEPITWEKITIGRDPTAQVHDFMWDHISEYMDATMGDEEGSLPIQAKLLGKMRIAQWKRAHLAWNRGAEVITVSGKDQKTYLVFYENNVVRAYDGKGFLGIDRYVYYYLPDGVVEAVEEYIQKNLIDSVD